MCTISFIGDQYADRWKWIPTAPPIYPNQSIPAPAITREEFEQLRKEVQDLRKLLIAAKAVDRATGQPDCEMAEKIELLRRVAEIVGVSLDDILG